MYVAVINTWTRAVKTLKQHKMTDKAEHDKNSKYT